MNFDEVAHVKFDRPWNEGVMATGDVVFNLGGRIVGIDYDVQAAVDARIRQRAQELLIEQEANKRIQQLQELYGTDVYVDGDVFKFEKQFVENGPSYLYAAIKAKGLWYTTGPKSPKGYSWIDFVLWLDSGVPAKLTQLMSIEDHNETLGAHVSRSAESYNKLRKEYQDKVDQARKAGYAQGKRDAEGLHVRDEIVSNLNTEAVPPDHQD